jgi:hypothetical protein
MGCTDHALRQRVCIPSNLRSCYCFPTHYHVSTLGAYHLFRIFVRTVSCKVVPGSSLSKPDFKAWRLIIARKCWFLRGRGPTTPAESTDCGDNPHLKYSSQSVRRNFTLMLPSESSSIAILLSPVYILRYRGGSSHQSHVGGQTLGGQHRQ